MEKLVRHIQRSHHRNAIQSDHFAAVTNFAHFLVQYLGRIKQVRMEYVSARDFRIVHFGGYTLVVVPTPAELNEGLAARIARERYSAQMSLAFREEQETVSLGADEGGRGSRGLNLSSLVDHLASKHVWIEALSDEDRAASLRVSGLHSVEGRLDEIVREIAMGRSLLES